MRNFKNTIRIVCALIVLSVAQSCSDVVDVVPQSQLSEGVPVSEEIMDNLITGAYAGLTARFIDAHHVTFQGPPSNWIADVRSDDAYKGGGGIVDQVPIHQIETWTHNVFSDIAFNKWLNLTWAIARVNNTLRILAAYDNASYPKEVRTAELKFLRAHFQFDFVRNFKKVPYLNENAIPSQTSNTEFSSDEILAKIETDLREAYAALPENQPSIGRVNKFTAAAYLCKVLIEEKKWSDAIEMADVIINSGRYELIDEFETLSTLEEENGKEIIFTIQFALTENKDWGHNIGDILNVTKSNAYPGGDDFYLGSQNLVNAFKTDENGLPLFGSFNEQPFLQDNSYSGPVDPRVDFTFGRYGVPWKQSGLYSTEWRRSLDYPWNYSCKKHILDANDPKIWDGQPWAASGLNFAIIRYAEVLLWKAEALIESNTDLNTARTLINQVRERAMNSTYVKTLDGAANAANYKIGLYPESGWTQEYAREALRFERRLELAMEGHRMFDINRWGITENVMTNYFATEPVVTPYLDGSTYKPGFEYLPIPQAEIDKAPTIYEQNEGYN
jgi:starch-binding outer membrane protein, SusD/RagB family